MSGRHRAPRQRYVARHRAPVRHTGAISVAALAIVGAAGGLSASYALSHGNAPAPHRPVASATRQATSGSGTPSTVSGSPSPSTASSPATAPPAGSSGSPSASSGSPAASRSSSHRRNAPPPSLVLQTLGGPSWIAVSQGGHQLVGRTFGPHHRLAFRQRHLTVTVGNAGAVVVRIAGHHSYRAGAPGEVRTFTT